MRNSQYEYFEAKAKRNRHRHVWWLFRKFSPFAVIAVLVVGRYLFTQDLEPTGESKTTVSSFSVEDRSAETYYPNCAAAWAAGVAPISYGDPGYREELDGYSDGIACEPYRRRR